MEKNGFEPIRIELIFGYEDEEGNVHKDVELGGRLKLKDLAKIQANPAAKNPMLASARILARYITKFGSLPIGKNGIDYAIIEDLELADIELLTEALDERKKFLRGRGFAGHEEIERTGTLVS